MTRKMRNLLNKKEEKRKKALELIEERKLDEARTLKDEIKDIDSEIELLRDLEEDEEVRSDDPGLESRKIESGKKEERSLEERYSDVYAKVLRNRKISSEEMDLIEEYESENRSLTEKVDADGGVLVPVDQRTAINEFKRSSDDLTQYVNVETVTTLSGTRVVENLAEMTPFEDLDGNDEIKETDNPKFKTISYTVKQKYGILPISNTLLKAGDKTLKKYVNKWIGKKARITCNADIITVLNTLTKVALTDFDAIKKVFNVTIDAALADTTKAYTNQDGFHKLDTMKDSDGKYILQPDPKDSTKRVLKGRPLVVLSNKTLKTTGTTTKKAPVIIGDLNEAVTFFEFENYELKTTDVGGNAFNRNTTDMRVIIGMDTTLVDGDAAVYGEITI